MLELGSWHLNPYWEKGDPMTGLLLVMVVGRWKVVGRLIAKQQVGDKV